MKDVYRIAQTLANRGEPIMSVYEDRKRCAERFFEMIVLGPDQTFVVQYAQFDPESESFQIPVWEEVVRWAAGEYIVSEAEGDRMVARALTNSGRPDREGGAPPTNTLVLDQEV